MTATQSFEQVLHEVGLDRQNQASLGRLASYGGIAYADEDSDGRMSARLRIVPDAIQWDPSVLLLPHGGTVDLELVNDDGSTHCAVLPSNGDFQFLWLPVYSKGTATIQLDGPGMYWYSSPIGNDEGRGLTAAIVVLGDVPEAARLDRPQQQRP